MQEDRSAIAWIMEEQEQEEATLKEEDVQLEYEEKIAEVREAANEYLEYHPHSK